MQIVPEQYVGNVSELEFRDEVRDSSQRFVKMMSHMIRRDRALISPNLSLCEIHLRVHLRRGALHGQCQCIQWRGWGVLGACISKHLLYGDLLFTFDNDVKGRSDWHDRFWVRVWLLSQLDMLFRLIQTIRQFYSVFRSFVRL